MVLGALNLLVHEDECDSSIRPFCSQELECFLCSLCVFGFDGNLPREFGQEAADVAQGID